ncbi:MAG: PD-(D/E)XK nuclease family protein [Clostridia bacterium]|nr:PD-(D/E)XK nuclease family protein [Clostridia bacterium]
MLQLLIGPSGSGKSRYVLDRLAALAATQQENILWLVPEQHSFESERTLLQQLGPVAAARVQVLSFSRLADMVFREVGGMAGERLDEGVRALLMSRALEQVAAVAADADTPMGGLRPRMATDSAYVAQLLTLWEELRQCAVPTGEWERLAEELADTDGQDALLTEKARDLYRVFTAYEGLAADTGLDDLDDLSRLAERLPDSRLPEGAAVFVDGFKGFTVQELQVLDRFLPRVSEMTVTLCTDTPGARWPGTSKEDCRREYTLFSPVTDTVNDLRRLAERHGLAWRLTRLTGNCRTDSGALQALEAGLYAPAPAVYEAPAPEVTVTPCGDVYEECAYVIRRIRYLLRQEGYRCRDIAVVVRNLPDYQGLLDEMLAGEGIPCYMDTRQDLLCEPLVVYIRAALRLAVGGWRTEELLRLMKTDLWTLSPVEIAEMENYVYIWRIEGSAWEREWTENPAGLGREMTAADRAVLARLNRHRAALMAPLSALRQSLRGTVTGRQFAVAVYTWLSGQEQLPRRIAAQAACLEQLAQPVLAAHAARLWDEIMGILDRFVLALGSQRLPANRLEDLFTMLCQMVDMGTIPQSLDAVTVGSADRIRYHAPRAVFVLGANEGVFPAYPIGEGVLTEEERRRLKAMGLTLAGDVLTQCVEERYYAYLALSAPRETLYVTYHTGGESAPSPLVTAIRRILPRHTQGVSRQPDGTDLETARETFGRLAEGYAVPTEITGTLRRVMADRPDYAHRLAAVERAAEGAPFRLEREENARALFGTDMCLSASQAERFYRCRFSYFCQYGLRVRPRRVADVDGSVFGVLVHHLMEVLLPRYVRPQGLVDRLRQQELGPAMERELMARLQEDVHREMDAYIRQNMGGYEEKSGRFMYQLSLAERTACNMLWHTVMELRQSAFMPVDFELNIHPEEEDAEGVVSLRLAHGAGSLQLRGKVDRVDIFHRFDGTAFVRVVDYKTGSTAFELGDVEAGLGMQMLLYLFILCDNSRRYLENEGQLRPGGVLYHKLSDLVVDRGQESADRLKKMCMEGVVLDDPSVLLAMEPGGDKCYIPASLDKGGVPTGNVVTLRQFQLLRRTVEGLLVGMADTLLAGDIRALPLQKGDRSPCTWCDYRAVCGRDAEDPVNEFKAKGRRAYLEELDARDEEVSHRG